MQVQTEITRIVEFLRTRIGDRTPVIGVSGGIDSAVTLMLLSRAFEPSRIHAYFLPDNNTPKTDYADVEALGKASGVEIHEINIHPMVESFSQTLGGEYKEALGNVKSRTRMIVLYYQSNISNGMVVGTTNRSEYMVGYYTKHGDGACDLEPIMHLLKREVRELARELNVPENIMNKKPSAGLWASQTDEDELGMSYEELDRVITEIFNEMSNKTGGLYDRVRKLYLASAHKRNPPASL